MRLLLLLPILAACTPEQPQVGNDVIEEASVEQPHQAPADGSLPPPPPPPPPAPSPWDGLLPLSEAQVVAALGTGASCAFGDGGSPLMVAVPGAAVANDRGRIVRLEAEAKSWEALVEGGSFKADGISIEIDAGAIVGREGEVTVRDASASLRRGRRGMGPSHGPRWSCGA